MWALVEDNTIEKIISNPTQIVIEDVRYPAKIFTLWTDAERQAIGIYNVIEDKTSGEYRLSHHLDFKTGKYKGRQILDPKE